MTKSRPKRGRRYVISSTENIYVFFANYELKVEFPHINLFTLSYITVSISELYISKITKKKATILLLKKQQTTQHAIKYTNNLNVT